MDSLLLLIESQSLSEGFNRDPKGGIRSEERELARIREALDGFFKLFVASSFPPKLIHSLHQYAYTNTISFEKQQNKGRNGRTKERIILLLAMFCAISSDES